MSRTTFYQKNYVGWPPVLIEEYEDPDSYHWQTKTHDMKFWLIKKMGEKEFEAWADRLFPDDSINESTWKQIHDLYEAKFRIYQDLDRTIAQLKDECGCVLPEQECYACNEIAELQRSDEIPY